MKDTGEKEGVKYHLYRTNGLVIASEIQFRELNEADGEVPDVFIHYGQTPKHLDSVIERGPRFEANQQEFLLFIPDVAYYWLKNRNEIIIEAEADVTENSIRLYILSSVFGALAHLWEFLPIHASTVEINGKVILFAGSSGTGKSTLAAGFGNRGYPILGDDVAAVSFNQEGIPIVHPSYRQVKLWADTLEHINKDPKDYYQIRPELEKFGWLLNNESCQAAPVDFIYINQGFSVNKVEFIEPSKQDKFLAIKNQTFRQRQIKALSSPVEHFKKVNAVIKHVPIKLMKRPFHPFDLNALLDAIENDLKL